MKKSVIPTVGGSDSEDWFYIAFPSSSRPGAGQPQLSFSASTPTGFLFDVYADCAGTLRGCGYPSATSAAGLRSWDFSDGPATTGSGNMVAWPTEVWVRVYRITTPTSCTDASYTLSVVR